jgi:hypothetical protein
MNEPISDIIGVVIAGWETEIRLLI